MLLLKYLKAHFWDVSPHFTAVLEYLGAQVLRSHATLLHCTAVLDHLGIHECLGAQSSIMMRFISCAWVYLLHYGFTIVLLLALRMKCEGNKSRHANSA